MLATPNGAAFMLWLALSRDNQELSLATIPEIIAEMTASEWRNLHRLLWQHHPLDELMREIMPDHGDMEKTTTWPEIIDYISRERRMRYAEVLDLTLPEISNMMRQGEPKKYGLSNPSPEAVREYQRRLLDPDEIPAWEAQQAELDRTAREAAEQAKRAAAADPASDPTMQLDAARLGMNPADLAAKLAELDALTATWDVGSGDSNPSPESPPESPSPGSPDIPLTSPEQP